MALKMKMFDTLGMVTLVTPPSMMNPEKISFTLINLKEKEKNHFPLSLPFHRRSVTPGWFSAPLVVFGHWWSIFSGASPLRSPF